MIFFDWEQDGKFNHVAIVKKVSGNTLTIIEGNARAGGIGVHIREILVYA